MKQKALLFTLIISLLLVAVAPVASAATQQTHRVYVYGQLVTSNAINYKGTTIAPFKPILEALGYTISYNTQTKTVRAVKMDAMIISFTANNKKVFVNGQPMQLTIAPQSINGTTYVPLRFVSEVSGEDVNVDPVTKNIFIATAPIAGNTAPDNNVSKPSSVNKPVNKNVNAFRNTKWGMTISQVKKSETAKFRQSEDSGKVLVYNGEVGGLDADIVYMFTKSGSLAGGAYFISEYLASDDYVYEYDGLKELFIKKYGSPTSRNDEFWRDTLFQDEPRYNWGTAVAAGHLSLMSTWKTNGTTITLILYGDAFVCKLAVQYTSDELYPKLEKERGDKEMIGI
ncbi:copper amine oxidase N-terminal domain-containing protein [Paenibacillus silvisoli]|uniref:copper amine oxidase N-terminal domain-containing protein n=1 Tax=Paenibacillus silvisoli TaxID=3110539 RepID=UPI0028060885|nr:copper amine oxidase N-terminal domain-containing protein [Paenibacillus silvisoli]